MVTFCEWLVLINEFDRTKFGLYPPGYAGIGLYPLPYYIPGSADAMTYMDMSDLHYYGYESDPFSITHIPGQPQPHGDHDLPGHSIPPKPSKMPGKIVKPKEVKMPGKVVRPTQWFKQPDFPDHDSSIRKGKVIKA